MKLICLEGCSGSGKTTQYKILDKYFLNSSKKFLNVVEKNYEPFKSTVEEWRKNKGPKVAFTKYDINMFAQARVDTYRNNFLPLTDKFDFILFDRYMYTSAVYQTNSDLNSSKILDININCGAPIPNLTLLFDCDSSICFNRAQRRDQLTGAKPLFSISPEKISFIRHNYLDLAKSRSEIQLVNTNKSVDEVTKEILFYIKSLF